MAGFTKHIFKTGTHCKNVVSQYLIERHSTLSLQSINIFFNEFDTSTINFFSFVLIHTFAAGPLKIMVKQDEAKSELQGIRVFSNSITKEVKLDCLKYTKLNKIVVHVF